MAKPISFGELDFKIVASMDHTREEPDPLTPFRILILGDFRGRGNRGVLEDRQQAVEWRMQEVDRDNIDEVLARLRPEIRLSIPGTDLSHISIRFRELDDFHPDHMYDRLKVFVMDVSEDEVAADLTASDDLKSARLYKLLVEQAVEIPGAEPWALVAGNFTFDRTVAHAKLLGRLAKITQAAGAPFIAAAHPHLLGCDSLHKTPDPANWNADIEEADRQAWETLRAIPEAAYLGLSLPRFLLRLPYGSDTDPVERFEFEEMPDTSVHKHYLWGNPAFASAYLIGKAFSEYGWGLCPGIVQDIGNLPLHVYKEQGETRIKPCAEGLLTEHAAEVILAKGVMPLLSFRDQDVIRPARFQSLADPPTHLAGRWRKLHD